MNAAAATERMRRELKSLVVQIKSKNVAHQLNGLTQLKIFSSADAENKELIREEGTIEPTVQLLGSENVKVQLAAVRLLRSLSVNEENQQRIADEDGIPPYVATPLFPSLPLARQSHSLTHTHTPPLLSLSLLV